MENFFSLKIGPIINYTIKQKPSFWFALLYLIVEYLRPQTMYPAINIIPWGNVVLVGLLFFIIVEQKLLKVKNVSNLYMMIFFLIVLLSSILAISSKVSFENIKNFYILGVIYYLIISAIDAEEKLFIFMGLFVLISLKLSQAVFINWVLRGFTYDKYGASVGSGWLENSGELAIQLCICFAISICFFKSLWPHNKKVIKILLVLILFVFAGGIIACGSRGSYLALAGILFFIWLGAKRKVFGIVIFLVLLFSIPLFISERDINRTLSMGGEGDSTAFSRLERWEKGLDMANAYPIFGVGFENWAIADKKIFRGSGAECHNIFIEAMSELGYVGLVGFLLLIYSTYKNNAETIMLARGHNRGNFLLELAISLNLSLLAYLIAGFFVTVLYYPYFWINIAMTVACNSIAKKKFMNQES